MKIIDAHTHIWGEDPAKLSNDTIDACVSGEEPEKNIRELEKLLKTNPELYRIGIIPLFGGWYPSENDICRGNDAALLYVDKDPQMFFGYFTVNPFFHKNSVEQINRAASVKNIRAIKSWVACRCDRKEFIPTVKACINNDMPLLVHAFYKSPQPMAEESTPDEVAVLAAKFPDAKIIMAHIGMDWSTAVRVIADCQNVYVDTSGSNLENGMIEKAVSYLGAERVIFGTDAPYGTYHGNVGQLKSSVISEDEKEKVAFNNATKLFDLITSNSND